MQLIQSTNAVFDELIDALEALTEYEYSKPCRQLSDTGIGQHVRHVIELYQCLHNGYESGVVNYEHRKRDRLIETDKVLAISLLQSVRSSIDKPDKPVIMECALGNEAPIHADSNYKRELIYNLEHTIHHMALIRIGIQEVSDVVLQDSFGVAPSTIQYRKACAQ